jgi:hypothetical protein
MRTLLDQMAPRHTIGEYASARQKRYFDKRMKERDGFEAGALVWIRNLRPGYKWLKGTV